MVSRFEPQVTEMYSKLLMNHLNSRRLVMMIRNEGNSVETGKPVTCKRAIPDCPRYPPNLSWYILASN